MKKVYSGEKRREICFPLGGIGSGSISLDGTGRFVDWEIFNRPSKGSVNGFSHFGIKAEADGKTIDARVMHSDLLASRTGRYMPDAGHNGYGYGPLRSQMCGMPHFQDCEFYGEFPLAEIRFIDDTFPGDVKLEAFNPFIPSNDADSSIPAAFFTAEVVNTTDQTITYTFELSVNNPSRRQHNNRMVSGANFHGIELADDLTDDSSSEYGRIVFGIPAGDALQIQQYWYRGNWFDNLGIFWRDFTAPGRIKNRVYGPSEKTVEDIATIAVSATVAPGEIYRQRFLIGWFYPNAMNYWSPVAEDPEVEKRNRRPWKNYYATLFENGLSVADYAMKEWDRLEAETCRFHDALFASSLPEAALEAVSANISILKTATVLRLTDGQFYGWEGCQTNNGSCEGSCTHVWNYAFALPFLFPKLERSMRELDYTYNLNDNGGMPFRLQLPLGKEKSNFRPCVDGQMGGIIKTYREWKMCGDDEWLRKWWPKVKKSLEYAWEPTSAERWDPERTGVITGRQHHTLDMELYGPNVWLNTFYIGALTAAAEMAEALNDDDAEMYRRMAAYGREFTDRELFNGEYYFQKVNIRDKSILEPYANDRALQGGTIMEAYWNEEAQQIKYQIAEGCGVDQVLAQWMCELSGIGELLDPTHVASALTSIYKYNFKPSLRNHFNPCRIFGMNDEAGLVICEWPEGKEKPIVPVPYAEETMHGFEYQAAIHMIMHGMEKEGMEVVRSIRNRYDGTYRNPWNEFECGSNYARSMASYALLLAYSGFRFDMRKKRMGMKPMRHGSYFWSVDGAWGTSAWSADGVKMDVLYGELPLQQWVVTDANRIASVLINGKSIDFEILDEVVQFRDAFILRQGTVVEAFYKKSAQPGTL